MKIGNGISSNSSEVMNDNMKYMKRLKEVYLRSKNENKIGNRRFGDAICFAIFYNAKHLTNVETLSISGK